MSDATILQLMRMGIWRGRGRPIAPPGPPPGGPKLDFDRVTSVTYNVFGQNVTFQAEKPFECARAADGKWPIMYFDQPTRWSFDKPARQVETTVSHNGLPVGTLMDIDGAQRNPYMTPYRRPSHHVASTEGKQGFNQIVQYHRGNQAGSRINYARDLSTGAPLNIDPALGVSGNGTDRGLILPGEQFDIVKCLTKAGMVQPPLGGVDDDGGSWRFFDLFAPFSVVNTTDIPRDPIPPGVCLAEKDWTNVITKAQLNKDVFGEGFTLPDGFLSLDQMRALGYFHTNFHAELMGLDGEWLRRWNISPAINNNESSGYSRDYAQTRADWLMGLCAAGADNVTDADMVDIAMYARQLDAVAQRLGTAKFEQFIGAGQWAGTKPLYLFGAFMAKDADPGMCDRMETWQANVTHQVFQAEQKHVGIDVAWGVPQTGGANHGVQKRTATPEDVGRYYWSHTFIDYDWAPQKRMDFEFNADYETDSAGIANFAEFVVIGLASAGPGGRKGWQYLCGTPAGNTKHPFSAMTKNQGRYAAGYYPRYYFMCTGTVNPLDTGVGSIITARMFNAYTELRDRFGIDRPTQAPDAPSIESGRTSLFVWPSANGVAYDLRDERLGGFDPEKSPILRRDIRWRIADLPGDWTVINDAPDQNADLAIPSKGRDIIFSHRRYTMIDGVLTPGPWAATHIRNYNTTTYDPIPSTQMGRVTPGGSGGAVTWPVGGFPKFMRKEFPLWYHSDFVPCETTLDATKGIDLTLGVGKPQGDVSAAPAYVQKRNGTQVATTRDIKLVGPDDLGVARQGSVTWGLATGDAAALTIPNRPAMPVGTIAKLTFGPEDELWNWEIYNTLVALSKTDPTNVMTIVRRDLFLMHDGSIEVGFMYGAKAGNNPRVRMDLAARYGAANLPAAPTTLRVKIGIGVSSNGAVSADPQLRMGTTITDSTVGTQLVPATVVSPDVVLVPSPLSARVVEATVKERTFAVTPIPGSPAYFQHMIPTGVGGVAGGNPETLEIEWTINA